MKKVLDRETFKKAYPPMRAGFEREVHALLSALPECKEETVVKKKLSLGLVLALVLLLAALATAVALSLPRAFFEDVGKMQVESGYYDEWTLDEKLQMLSLMEKYGVVLDADVAAKARDTKLSAQEREQALDAYMADQYGVLGRIDVISLESILNKEKGPIQFWSVEDKAWYITFQRDLGLLPTDEEQVYCLPEAGDMTQEQAEALARAAAKEKLGWTDAQLLSHKAYFAILRQYPSPDKVWEVLLLDPEENGACFTFPAAPGTTVEQADISLRERDTWLEDLTQKVSSLEAKYGPMKTWGLTAKHEYLPDYYLLPDADDLPLDKALTLALEAVTQAYPAASRDALLALRADYSLMDTYIQPTTDNGETVRTMSVMFLDDRDNIRYGAYLNARTGETLKTLDYTKD